jgi:hypothetical protein
MANVAWKWCAASVCGFDHLASSLPCQDSHAVRMAGVDRFIAVVADGAGSARRSGDGSQTVCHELATWLTICLDEFPDLEIAGSAKQVRWWLDGGINSIRRRLSSTAEQVGESLKEFHATVVGVVADRSGGVIFHIGDGAGLASLSTDLSRFTLSPAENGQYANETYFFTQDVWRDHLRLTPFGPEYDLIVLMSDGVTPVALARGGKAPFAPFLVPVSKFLDGSDYEAGQVALNELLGRESMRNISGDDKTLVWAKRYTSG